MQPHRTPPDWTWESLGNGPLNHPLSICTSPRHTFGEDSFLLADFAQAKSGEPVADLGAGCGILSILLYKLYFCKEIYGIELQSEAVSQFSAAINASALTNTIRPIQADLRNLSGPLPFGKCGLAVCNPPYFQSSPSPDPVRAAARTELTCTLSDVCAAAKRLLRFGGRLCLCLRPERLPELFSAMSSHQIEPKRLRLAAHNPAAVPWLALVEGRLGGKPGLRIEPGFFSYHPDGSPTEEKTRLYQQHNHP